MALKSTISNTILDPNGNVVAGAPVTITLQPTAGFRVDDSTEVARVYSTVTNASGVWSALLERNSNITPANTTYEVVEQIPQANGGTRVWQIQVGASDQTVSAAQVSVPPAATQSAFLTQAAGDARYQALGGLGSGSPTTSAVGDAAAAGVSASASRADHGHGREAFGTPVSTGTANAAGSAATVARSDHVHKGLVSADAWTAWTPTLTQSGAVTKTVNYAHFVQLGKLVIAQCDLTVTGTGTGANNVIVGLPVTAVGAVQRTIGMGYVYDSSATLIYTATIEFSSTSTAAFRATSSTVNGFLGASTFTAALAVGDLVSVSVMYEAA